MNSRLKPLINRDSRKQKIWISLPSALKILPDNLDFPSFDLENASLVCASEAEFLPGDKKAVLQR
ncbi:MAG: hypothetical protein WB766_22830, partial [Roseiarcus sp.]